MDGDCILNRVWNRGCNRRVMRALLALPPVLAIVIDALTIGNQDAIPASTMT